ncbi:hypothetical protein KKE06_01340 [Candidatus Micrarchaeota archaeon]|nr:hypothetical protein [Candidatus Micrarchaeota archaeon]
MYGTDSIAYESCVNSIMLLDTGECSAPYSVGGGYNAFITSVDAAVCWGEGVNCSGEMVSGLGAFTILSGVHSTGVGQSIDISGDYGVGIGSDITVSNDNSMVLGRSFSSSDENVLYSTHKAFVINGDVNANRFCFPDGTCMTSAGISETDTNDLILWDLDSNYLVPKQGWDINMGDNLLNLDTDLNKIIIGASSSPNTTKVRISDSTNTFATLFGLDRNISSRQINTIDFSVNTTLSYVGASVSGLGHVIGNYTFYDNRKITSGVADAVQSMFMQVSRGSDFNSVSRAHTMNGLYLSVSDSGTYSAPTPVPPIALVTTATGSNITTSSFFKSDLGVGKTLTYNLTGMKLDGSSNYTLVSGALNYNYKGIDITLAGDTEGLSKGYAFYSNLAGFDERWNIYNDSDSNNFMGSGDTNFSDNFHFRADGNVTMKSPDGSFWNCGVTNAGTFQCSTP